MLAAIISPRAASSDATEPSRDDAGVHGPAAWSAPTHRDVKAFDQLQRNRARVFEDQLFRETAAMAARVYEAASPAGQNDYLGLLEPHSARFTRNSALIVPGRDVAGFLWNYLRIERDGTRRFPIRGRTGGLMTWVGELRAEHRLVLVAHDIRDASLLHRETNVPIACALTPANSRAIAAGLRERFPHLRVAIVDADLPTRRSK